MGGYGGAHHAHGYHPVTEHSAQEKHEPASGPGVLVTHGAALPDFHHFLAHGTDNFCATHGKIQVTEKGNEQGPAEVAERDKTPTFEHPWHSHSRSFVEQGKRHKSENPGEQVVPHKVKHAETDRKQQRAQKERAGLNGDS